MNIVGQTELCDNWITWNITVEVLVVLIINVIMNLIVVSTDHVVVRIVVGWVVFVSLGSQGCWGGDKTYFREISI